MPLVRIDLRQGNPPAYRKAIGDGVHIAMIEAIAIPPDDRFQLINEHDPQLRSAVSGHSAFGQSCLHSNNPQRRA